MKTTLPRVPGDRNDQIGQLKMWDLEARRHILNGGGGFADKTCVKLKPMPVCGIAFTCGGVKASISVVN